MIQVQNLLFIRERNNDIYNKKQKLLMFSWACVTAAPPQKE